MTVSARDCDELEKVIRAGELVETASGHRAQVMHNGVLVEADGYCGSWMTEVIRCLKGHHEPQEEYVFAALLDRLRQVPGPRDSQPTIIEFGSYWAYYALWFLHAFPDGQAVCVEPDPDRLALGQRNFRINDRCGRFIQAAAGVTTGEGFVLESGRRVTVPVVCIGDVLADCGIEEVDVVHADIQGAETTLIAEAGPLLASGIVRFLVVSTHDMTISGCATTHQEVLGQLEALGATIVAEHSVPESFSGDGLVVAAFRPEDADLTVPVSRARSKESLFGELEYRCEDLRREAATWRQRAESAEALLRDDDVRG